MPLIECKFGHTETYVGSINYSFDKDAAGRYVAEVYDLTHVMCLLSVEHYREVQPLDALPPAPATVPVPAETPAVVVPVATPVTPETEEPVQEMGFGIIAGSTPDPHEDAEADDASTIDATAPDEDASDPDPVENPDTGPEPVLPEAAPLPAPAIVLPVASQQKKLARRRGRGK